MDDSLLRKNLLMLDLSRGGIIGVFYMLALLLLTEMIIDMNWNTPWIFGAYLIVALVIINVVLFAVGYIGSLKIIRSEEYGEMLRFAQSIAEAEDLEVDAKGYGKAAMAGGIAASAAGRVASQSSNEKVSGVGDAATVAGAATMAAGYLYESGSKRKQTKAIMEIIDGVPVKKNYTVLLILLIETLFVLVPFIPACINARSAYYTTADTIQAACDEIASGISGFDAVHTSVYEDTYGYVHAYLDEDHESYISIQVDSDGELYQIYYHVSTDGVEDIEDAAEMANQTLFVMMEALSETTVANTIFYTNILITEDALNTMVEGEYYRVTDENGAKIVTSYHDDYFLVFVEA